MFEKEVKYRLCRVLLANLVGKGILSGQQVAEINKLLREKLDPEFRSVETTSSCVKNSIQSFVLLKTIPIKLEMG